MAKHNDAYEATRNAAVNDAGAENDLGLKATIPVERREAARPGGFSEIRAQVPTVNQHRDSGSRSDDRGFAEHFREAIEVDALIETDRGGMYEEREVFIGRVFGAVRLPIDPTDMAEVVVHNASDLTDRELAMAEEKLLAVAEDCARLAAESEKRLAELNAAGGAA